MPEAEYGSYARHEIGYLDAGNDLMIKRWISERTPRNRAGRSLLSMMGDLLRDRRGGIILFFAIAAVPLIAAVGIATDTARMFFVKSRLTSAVDAASLAGGKVFAPERDADVRMYFDTNFPPGFMGSTLTSFDIDANNDDETLTVAATVSIPTTFVRMFGYGDVPVSASAEVVRKQTALDVVMAIDISGSMGWSAPGGGSRIDAAKQAAEDLVDILFGDDATKPFLNIGLVPWNAKVNVMTDGDPYNPGSTTTESVAAFINPETGASQNELYYANNSHVPLLSFPPPNWRGCVFSRYLSGLPADGQADIEKEPYSGGGVDWMGWQPIFPGEHTQWGGEPKWGGVCELSVGGEECADCSSSRILPLTNVKSEVLDAIDGLGSSGNTNIPAGLGWAWRVLTPEPPFTQAVLNPDYNREQAIVLLTDGENCAASGDGYRAVFGLCGWSGSRDAMDERLRLLSANVKADGVRVYVIQFANEGSELQTLLKEVASGPDTPYYYYAPSRDSLLLAFHEIANHLSQLRLTK